MKRDFVMWLMGLQSALGIVYLYQLMININIYPEGSPSPSVPPKTKINESPLADSNKSPAKIKTPKILQNGNQQWYLNNNPRPYTIDNVLSVVDVYGSDMALIVYDPKQDAFFAHSPKYHVKGRFITNILPKLTDALRYLFPDKFYKDAPHEVAFVMVSDDYPLVTEPDIVSCMKKMKGPCAPKDLAPILQFGSVFKSPILQSMVHMPPPAAYLFGCFDHWMKNKEVCKFYTPRTARKINGFVFGETVGVEWDDLIPQIVWRGSDMGYLDAYLPTMKLPAQRRLIFDKDIAPKIKGVKPNDVNSTATKAAGLVYDELIPRWQGVVWTAMAEREAETNPGSRLPWANIKFTKAWNGTHKLDVGDYPSFVSLEEHGIPCMGEFMSLEEVAKYKYHIDLGGNGGERFIQVFIISVHVTFA